ncbi:MAG: hypothetical protein J1E42_04590 [Akkermansiaceae bacterium]|nr:hypothetical protein [Akkermansiaceae bacterium]
MFLAFFKRNRLIIQALLAVIALHGGLYLYNEWKDNRSCVIDGVSISARYGVPFLPIVTLPVDVIRATMGEMSAWAYGHRYVFSYEWGGVRWQCESPETDELLPISPETVRIVDLPSCKVVFVRDMSIGWTELIRLPKATWSAADPWGMPLVEKPLTTYPFRLGECLLDEIKQHADSGAFMLLLRGDEGVQIPLELRVPKEGCLSMRVFGIEGGDRVIPLCERGEAEALRRMTLEKDEQRQQLMIRMPEGMAPQPVIWLDQQP